MLIKLALAPLALVVAAGFTGCVPCNSDVTEHGLAARPQYDTAIDACITKGRCIELCRSAFKLDAAIEIDSCKIERVDTANAHLLVRYYDPNACVVDDTSDDDLFYSDDGGDDDGGYSSDDGSTDDDSTDDGSTDDGSSDDGSTDDGDYGGDDGGDSGDDGGDWDDRKVPSHPFVKSVTSTKAAQ